MQEPKILVAIRKRPLNTTEKARGDADIINVESQSTVVISQHKLKVDLTKYIEQSSFKFDYAFSENQSNEKLYTTMVKPLVSSAFKGAKVTCFAYGQTGSGKTFTMNGNHAAKVKGLYELAIEDIFRYLNRREHRGLNIKASFYEIYCKKLFDLLNERRELRILEDAKSNVNILGLEEKDVQSPGHFNEILQYGSCMRVTSQNSQNSQSSRSHAILQLTIYRGSTVMGKLSFIDLAGNERAADHVDMSKQTRIDGAQINKSLLALKQCIRALDHGRDHVPFRGSKLTMVLKDSFTGFCRTLMIGNIAPSSTSAENTLNTLRYADRVKELGRGHEPGQRDNCRVKEILLSKNNLRSTTKPRHNMSASVKPVIHPRWDGSNKNESPKPKPFTPLKRDSNRTRSLSQNKQVTVSHSAENNEYSGETPANQRNPNPNILSPPRKSMKIPKNPVQQAKTQESNDYFELSGIIGVNISPVSFEKAESTSEFMTSEEKFRFSLPPKNPASHFKRELKPVKTEHEEMLVSMTPCVVKPPMGNLVDSHMKFSVMQTSITENQPAEQVSPYKLSASLTESKRKRRNVNLNIDQTKIQEANELKLGAINEIMEPEQSNINPSRPTKNRLEVLKREGLTERPVQQLEVGQSFQVSKISTHSNISVTPKNSRPKRIDIFLQERQGQKSTQNIKPNKQKSDSVAKNQSKENNYFNVAKERPQVPKKSVPNPRREPEKYACQQYGGQLPQDSRQKNTKSLWGGLKKNGPIKPVGFSGCQESQIFLKCQVSEQAAQNWIKMIDCATRNPDEQAKAKARAELRRALEKEQKNVTNVHGAILNLESDSIRNQNAILRQVNRGVSCRQYTESVLTELDAKLIGLQKLRDAIIDLTFKLDDIEQIEMLEKEGIVSPVKPQRPPVKSR